jgi:hypothetical protein
MEAATDWLLRLIKYHALPQLSTLFLIASPSLTPIFHLAQQRANLWNQCEGTGGRG